LRAQAYRAFGIQNKKKWRESRDAERQCLGEGSFYIGTGGTTLESAKTEGHFKGGLRGGQTRGGAGETGARQRDTPKTKRESTALKGNKFLPIVWE